MTEPTPANKIATSDLVSTGEWNIENLPEYLSEDELTELLIQYGIFDKLLLQIEQTPPSTDWEAELNEL
jgi:hypothetical protein